MQSDLSHRVFKKDTIGITSHVGYSSVGCRTWHAKRTFTFNTAEMLGERRVSPHGLDGWCQETATAYEFHGCFHHGCPKCYPGDRDNPVVGVTMYELHERTLTRREYLETQGYNIVEMWECDFNHLLKTCKV